MSGARTRTRRPRRSSTSRPVRVTTTTSTGVTGGRGASRTASATRGPTGRGPSTTNTLSRPTVRSPPSPVKGVDSRTPRYRGDPTNVTRAHPYPLVRIFHDREGRGLQGTADPNGDGVRVGQTESCGPPERWGTGTRVGGSVGWYRRRGRRLRLE